VRRASDEPGKIAKRAPRAPRYSRPARVLQPDVRQQPGQQSAMDVVALRFRVVDLQVGLLRRLPQLPDEGLPLAHAQVVQVVGLAALAELVAGQ